MVAGADTRTTAVMAGVADTDGTATGVAVGVLVLAGAGTLHTTADGAGVATHTMAAVITTAGMAVEATIQDTITTTIITETVM